jgi:hypothetical protein
MKRFMRPAEKLSHTDEACLWDVPYLDFLNNNHDFTEK